MPYGPMPPNPDLSGVGKAWRIPMSPLGQRGSPDADGTVEGWLLYAPTAHPLWSYWSVSVVHLRPILDVKPPHLAFPEATHELMIMALDPDHPLPDLTAIGSGAAAFRFLTPIDVVQQFTVQDDVQAVQVCEWAVRACVGGRASPDQDWRRWWTQMIPQTAAHVRGVAHGDIHCPVCMKALV